VSQPVRLARTAVMAPAPSVVPTAIAATANTAAVGPVSSVAATATATMAKYATTAPAVSQPRALARVTPSAVQGSATNLVARVSAVFQAVTPPVMGIVIVARATPAAEGPAVIPRLTPV